MDVGVDEAGQQVGPSGVNDFHRLGMREAEDFASAHADVRFPDFAGQHVHQLRVGNEKVGGAAPAAISTRFFRSSMSYMQVSGVGNRGKAEGRRSESAFPCFPQTSCPLQSVFFEDGSRVKE